MSPSRWLLSFGIETQQEQPGRVGRRDGGVALGQHRAAGLEGHAAQSRRRRGAHRLGSDRRQVGAAILAGLDQLDQHAAGARPRQRAGARQHRIGALHRLDRQHDALLHHAALADIDRAERPRHRDAAGDIGHRLRVRRRAAEQPGRAERLGQHLVGAEDAEPFLAQHPHDRRQQPVIAGEGGAADARQDARALGIRPQIQQRRPAHRRRPARGRGSRWRAALPGSARRADADDRVRKGREHGGLGKAFQPTRNTVAPGRTRRPRPRGPAMRRPRR